MAEPIGQKSFKQPTANIAKPAAKQPVAGKTTKGASSLPDAHISKTAGIPKKEAPVDSSNPILPLPTFLISSAVEAQEIEDNLKAKLKDPIPINIVAQRVAQPSPDLKKRRDTAAKEIPNLVKSKDSFAAMMQIQKLLLQASNISIDISGATMELYGRKQIEQQEKSSKKMLEQIKAQQRFINAGLASKILSWFGDIINLVSATIALVGSIVSTVATGGVLTPALIASGAWLTGALTGIAGHVLDETGALKNSPEWIGITIMVSGAVLSIGGFAMTGGITATIKAGDATFQTVLKGVTIFQDTMPILQGVATPVAKITSAAFKYQVEGLRADKTEIEKEQNQIEYMINKTAKGLTDMLTTLNEHQIKQFSDAVREQSRTISAILGNI